MIEVELKFEIVSGSWKELQANLDVMPLARCIEHIKNVDTYYDTAGFDLLQQAVFVRIRNHAQLEFKFNEQAATVHIQSTERVFSLMPEPHQAEEMNALFSRFLPQWRSADTVEEALHKNSLIELAHIENRRVQYAYDDLVICVDQVEGLGDFLEIEKQCEEGSDTSQAEARVHCFASDFATRQVRVGYVELWLQKHHPQAYQRGKYQE